MYNFISRCSAWYCFTFLLKKKKKKRKEKKSSNDLVTPRTGEHDRMLNSSQEENTESRGTFFIRSFTWCTFDARSLERSTPRRDRLEPRKLPGPSFGDCCPRKASSRPVPSLLPRSALSFRYLRETRNCLTR